MDNSQEYILMCERSKEIQEGRFGSLEGWENNDFYYFYNYRDMISTYKNGHGVHTGKKPEIHKKNRGKYACSGQIWLPRQDQLQDLILGICKYQRPTIATLINDFRNWMFEKNSDAYKYNSIDKLWLCYYMKFMHNKKWNGKYWIAKKK